MMSAGHYEAPSTGVTLDVLIAVCRLKTVCSVLVKLLVILLEVCVLSDRGTNFLFWKIILLLVLNLAL